MSPTLSTLSIFMDMVFSLFMRSIMISILPMRIWSSKVKNYAKLTVLVSVGATLREQDDRLVNFIACIMQEYNYGSHWRRKTNYLLLMQKQLWHQEYRVVLSILCRIANTSQTFESIWNSFLHLILNLAMLALVSSLKHKKYRVVVLNNAWLSSEASNVYFYQWPKLLSIASGPALGLL